MKSKQQGLTFLGLLIVGGLVAFFGMVAAQAFPGYIEYLAIEKAVKKAAGGTTVLEVQSIFDKAASIDAIGSIAGKDLEITKVNDKVLVKFAYQREIALGGPAYLVMKYKGSSR